MRMDGTLLAASYAFPPNRLGYCGRAPFRAALERSLREGAAGRKLAAELRGFHAHHSYLSLISEASGLDVFDERVVRAFWIGNRLLDAVGNDALRVFIRGALFGGRQRRRAAALCANLPPGAVPHHSFNALFVNFVNPDVGGSIRNIDSCCVTQGKVIRASERTALIMREAIIQAPSGYGMAKVRSRIALERGGMRFVGKIRPGDALSVHWGMAIERLGARDSAALREYTLKNIRALSKGQ